MIDGSKNKRSGIVVVMLPESGGSVVRVAFDDEKELLYPDITNWRTVSAQNELELSYPNLPARIYDNIAFPAKAIPITTWSYINDNPNRLGWLVKQSAQAASNIDYNLARKMRRRDSAG